MKKQTISKIAALTLAVMTAVPTVGIGASADIVLNRGNSTIGNQQEITGTAYYLEWYTTENLKNYTVVEDPIAHTLSVQQVGSDINSYYNNENDAVANLGEVGAGHAYYGYSNIRPAAYQRLVDEVTKANNQNTDGEAAIRKAIANYNSDLTKYNTNVKTIENKPIIGSGSTERYNSVTYTDSMNNTIVITHNGSAVVATKNGGGYAGPAIDDYASIANVSAGMSFPIAKFNVVGTPQTLTMAQLSAKLGTQYVDVENGTLIITGTAAGTGAWYINTGASNSGNNNNTNTDSTIASSATFSSTYPWYSSLTRRYYRTSTDATAASNGDVSYVSYGGQESNISSSSSYSSTYHWYSSLTRRYYKTYSDAVAASNNNAAYVSDASSYSDPSSSTYSSTYHWYSSYTRRYYQTYAAALAASNGNTSYVSDASANSVSSSSAYSSTYPWYSSYTRRYYRTYSDAVTASNGNSSYVSQGNYYDPYYYYYNMLGGYSSLGYSNTNNNNSDTSSVTIGNLKGWNAVTRTINSAKSGTSYTVNMKNETEIPSNVLSALKGKNVDVNFKFSNGSVVTLNGSDIDYTSTISPVIQYGSTSIPSSLKKKAVQSNDGVSSSQLTINGGSLGASASVTVKFNEKRSGCSAKLYRYNPSANTLSLVSRSSVGSNGRCTFDNVKQGGEYIVVLS